MFKTLGILMVLSACVLFSYTKAEELRAKYENLKQLVRALSIIKNEISFSSRELSDTAKELSETLSGDLAKVFSLIHLKLTEDRGTDFGQAWEESVDAVGRGKLLSSDVLKLMGEFSHLAGKMSKEIEIENIDKTAELLECEIKAEAENFTKNRKLIFSLGGVLGLSVMILFL